MECALVPLYFIGFCFWGYVWYTLRSIPECRFSKLVFLSCAFSAAFSASVVALAYRIGGKPADVVISDVRYNVLLFLSTFLLTWSVAGAYGLARIIEKQRRGKNQR